MIRITLRLSLSAFCLAALCAGAAAEDPAAIRIATVDINRVMNELNDAKQAKKELENLSAEARQKLEQQKKKLDALEKKIRDEKVGENSDEAAKYRKAAREFQTAAGDAKEQLNREFMKVNKTISDRVVKAVQGYAADHNLDLVLDKSARAGSPVLFGDPGADITDEVIKKLGQ